MKRHLLGRNQMRRVGGFSLLEMLVALTIMGLSLSVLYQSVSGATRNTRVASEYAIATALAESTMDEFANRLRVGEAVRGDFGEYRWSAIASPKSTIKGTEIDAAADGGLLSLLTVSVEWQGLGGNRIITLHTIERAVRAGDAS